ncbi:MAG TPA: FAD-dependent oxidoreductase [Bordetella sp.]|uniref:FAD-dependent oxidoreductase n=1 Tax=Bordetella sp. TaxID=28081 RepID=UPI002ED32E8A
MSTPLWEREVDVLVVGGGAGGMAAALSAHIGGCKVLLAEKTDRIGGSTAISGGAVWAPLNSQSGPAGHPDSFEKVWTYMRNTVGDAAPAEMQKAFLDACGPAIDALARHTAVQLAARTYSPDYYPDRDGAALGGRSLDPVMFDGRQLGRHFRELRDPLPEFMVLGGMMVTLADAKNLLGAFRSFGACKESMKLVLRYAGDRLRGYHRGTRLVLGNALAARLFRSLLDRGIDYWLGAPLKSLHVQDGRVTGACIERQGRATWVRAKRAVVVATGGFPWNPAMRGQRYPQPTGPWSMSPAGNAGEGIELAQTVGAAMGSDYFGPAFWAPVSILQRPDGTQVRYPHLVWDRAKPGLMAVNSAGRRFVNESASYHEFVLGMYRSHETVPTIPAYLVCDSDFMERWGLGLALPGGRPREHLLRDGYLYRANSLQELASALQIDAAGLSASADDFNRAGEAGVDPAFGKGSTAYNQYLGDPDHRPNPCLGPLRKAPFYAVKVYAGDIGTACGIRCNAHAQALAADGQPVAGLYVVGNDMQSVMGGQYPAPGITLGPALTFGWVAGQHIAQTVPSQVSS